MWHIVLQAYGMLYRIEVEDKPNTGDISYWEGYYKKELGQDVICVNVFHTEE